MAKLLQPFVSQFDGKSTLTAVEFIQQFEKFDKNGNGFIEKLELDDFLKDLTKNKTDEEVNKEQLEKFKIELLSKYDENSDGKISLKEIARVLPTEENFLLQYRDEKRINVVDFIKIWYHYDVNRNGYLEASELKGFLHDLEEDTNNPMDPQKLDEYVQAMFEMFDKNDDGRIELAELSQLLPMEENFLLKFKDQKRLLQNTLNWVKMATQSLEDLTSGDFDTIFEHYDRDRNGQIEDNELLALLKDITCKKTAWQGSEYAFAASMSVSEYMLKEGKDVTTPELEQMSQQLSKVPGLSKDGKLTKDDLRILLCRN